jgi:hypothetical protein
MRAVVTRRRVYLATVQPESYRESGKHGGKAAGVVFVRVS